MHALNKALAEKATVITNVVIGKMMDVQVGFSDFLYDQKIDFTAIVYRQLSDPTIGSSLYVKLVMKYNWRVDQKIDVGVYAALLELMVFKEDHLYKPTE